MESANSPTRSRHITGIRPPSEYPPGTGFATGHISLGEVDVVQVATFEEVWNAFEGGVGNKGATFYKPVDVPAGYSILSHYAQSNSRARAGWVLAIKETGNRPAPPSASLPSSSSSSPSPPSSPHTVSGSLNPFSSLMQAFKEGATDDVPNSLGRLHPTSNDAPLKISTDASLEASGEDINPYVQLAVVPNVASTEEAEENVESLADYVMVPNATETETAQSISSPEKDSSKSLVDFVTSHLVSLPPLKSPVDFKLIWDSSKWSGMKNGNAWVWLPIAPERYSVLGYIVTNTEDKPMISAVTCVRTDLTDILEIDSKFFTTSGISGHEIDLPFSVWTTRPAVRGVSAAGVNVGSFFCAQSDQAGTSLPIVCLKNVEFNLSYMPTMAQVNSIQQFFGPTVVFHPAEQFLPSSVAWFFASGAMLYTKDSSTPPVRINSDGSNLPQGGNNDGAFWIDLPKDGTGDTVKKGKLETAKLHIHLKPVYGATYTDLQSWIFCPFNGPSTARVGKVNIPLGRLGEHVSDWEHYTLRVSNFTGEMEAIYFSQHSKGQWVNIWDLEFDASNKPLVYVAKNGHPCYPHQGDHLQGDESRGVGLRNDTALSTIVLDSPVKFQVFSADYMHQRGDKDAPEEPAWLQYMREWGPKIEYDKKKYLEKFLKFLPSKLRNSLEEIFDKLPSEVMGQEGPTGPKEKNMWFGDERI